MKADATEAVFLTDYDLHLMGEGTHLRLFEKLGAHAAEWESVRGTRFAVWAPNARRVSIIGDFNGWRDGMNGMVNRGGAGIWEGFVPGIGPGALYKYAIESPSGERLEKADPFAFAAELRPLSASKVSDLSSYTWSDDDWMAGRVKRQALDAPISIYEVHLGSWMRVPEENNRWLTYRELAPKLADYLRDTGFTHVELLPMTEHPFDGSWGYQTIGYYAPTSRFGSPQDFMYMIDTLHQAGLGVVLDWVPAHFPRDGHGLARFDGTHIYEHADPRQGAHPDWGTLIFNYGRTEVQNFLLSNALFWLDRYHIDGLRIDAVASMLYLDYSRETGDWIPNRHGGRENLEAIAFLRRLNEVVYGEFPGAMTIAEESTSWPMVSRPTYVGGLGFGYKWDMGWMNDMLSYMRENPIHRRYHHNKVTFRMLYAWHENFLLPLSHDEVVHGKGSLIGRMPGDDWQRFANLRLLLGAQWAQPGKKLLFMGCEFAQWAEWNHDRSLDWHLLAHAPHRGIHRLVSDLNRMYRGEPSLHQGDVDPRGFEWVDCSDTDQSVLIFARRGLNPDEAIVFAFNFTPVPRHNYRIGVPWPGHWAEVFNTDAALYGGSGQGNLGGLSTSPVSWHGHMQSLNAVLPPLAMVAFKGTRIQALARDSAGGAVWSIPAWSQDSPVSDAGFDQAPAGRATKEKRAPVAPKKRAR